MPKRKRGSNSSTSTTSIPQNGGNTFSLMDGKVDLLEGLVHHKEVISKEFEDELISFVQTQCERGRRGELKKPTYLRASGARSQGNQREAVMYGGFFDFNRARPGKRGLVPPFTPILQCLVDQLMLNNYLPVACRPDSCIINQYAAGDCIPPHVDHSSYYRPIATLSLLGEESMLVGSRFRTVRSCTWAPVCGESIPLARRSLLVLGGNSGNIAKHCISACKGPRISITLRKQPPPDWKPDESELVGKKRKLVQDSDSRSDGRNGRIYEEHTPAKKKALSGSAKRRKKTTKQSGRSPIPEGGGGGTESGSRSNHTMISSSSSKGSTKNNNSTNTTGKSANKKNLAKQARRNARRLEKKMATEAEGK